MQGKRGLIMGLANDKSLAWGIAQKLREHGAETRLHLSQRGNREARAPAGRRAGQRFRASPAMSATWPRSTRPSRRWPARWPTIDFLVHAIGASDKNELRGRYSDTSLDNFLMTMNISVYSLTAVAKRALRMMPEGGSILTLTYYGAEKVVPHYNVMGVAKSALEASVRYLADDLGPDNIRVNAISAGPIRTLAASGIGDFNANPQVERAERAAAAQRHDRGCRRRGALPAVRPVVRASPAKSTMSMPATTSSA